MFRTLKAAFLFPVLALGLLAAPAAQADTPAPVQVIQKLSESVMTAVNNDPAIKSGDPQKVMELVETTVLPFVDFRHMTASAVGRYWRQATPEQQKDLQQQFKLLLIHTYSGAVSQIRNQKIDYLPFRAAPDATNVVVRTRVMNNGEPIQLDYRLVKVGSDWKITDVNVMGIWLVDNYRGVFAQEIGQKGINGLIQTLETRNKQLAHGGQGQG
ncbi:ABC transporter substrate-binding protein [Thiomonas sp.]|uniref:MlaC/ttg2D family ABC transporter substrate-binding protein n=1 Tax=Thiomonas sp. TaxID=2047785 RepID=UPI0025866173|nr:ABC transporter substrate-binding protein [Thiomonas sp.]